MHSAEIISSDYVSAEQLAKELKRTMRTLMRWRNARTGPPITMIGRTVYYRRQAVKEWLLAMEGANRVDLRSRIERRPLQRNARRHNARRATVK